MTIPKNTGRKAFGRMKTLARVATAFLFTASLSGHAADQDGGSPVNARRSPSAATHNIALLIPSQRPPPRQDHVIPVHAIVVRTSPAQGGSADGSINKVEVWYDAGIRDAFVALAVVSASGERVDNRDAAIDSADPAHVSVSVNQLSAGKYTARYRALSADGHMVSGAWDFEILP